MRGGLGANLYNFYFMDSCVFAVIIRQISTLTLLTVSFKAKSCIHISLKICFYGLQLRYREKFLVEWRDLPHPLCIHITIAKKLLPDTLSYKVDFLVLTTRYHSLKKNKMAPISYVWKNTLKTRLSQMGGVSHTQNTKIYN